MPREKVSKENLVVLGTSLFAPEVTDLAEDTGSYKVSAFIENWDKGKTLNPFLGRPVIWIDEAETLVTTHKAVCALGTTRRKNFIEHAFSIGFKFATIIHPSVRLSKESKVGEGSVLSVGVIVAAYTNVGRHVIINRGSLIGHNTTIHDYVTVSPGANIAGSVTIGEGTYVGMGSIILDYKKIGANSVIGAGAVVTHDVPDSVLVMGVPARIIKKNIDGK